MNPILQLIGFTRGVVNDLYETRAKRLCNESESLPPTHFTLLSILTSVILVGFLTSTGTVSDQVETNQTRFLFSLSATVYVLFYAFALDLNSPFRGVYQIRRSSAVAHLLQIRMLLTNSPTTKGKLVFSDEDDEQGN